MNLYKMLWSRIGGRPWTYITRDLWHKFEFVWIVGLVCLGVWLGHNYEWLTVIKIILIFSTGYVFGHFFWGTKYVEGQPGK